MTEEKLVGDQATAERPVAASADSASANVEGTQAELDQLRRELDEHKVASKARQHRGRRWAVALLIVLGCILLAAANLTFWLRGTVLSTNGWVAAIGPLSRNETIANAMSLYVVGEVFDTVDVASLVAEALPEKVAILSGPLTGVLQDLAQDAVTTAIQSDPFNAVWVAVNRTAHATAMEILRGNGSLLYLREGRLTVDLSDILDYIQGAFGLEALGLFAGEDWGKFVLLESQQVASVQQVLGLIGGVGLVVPLLALAVLVVAWVISLWRRRTLLWIGIGVAITMALSLIGFAVAQPLVLISIADPLVRLLAGEIWDVILRGLYIQTIVILVVGLLLVAGAVLAGPAPRAVAIRTGVRQQWDKLRRR